jgi:hypothetical protein
MLGKKGAVRAVSAMASETRRSGASADALNRPAGISTMAGRHTRNSMPPSTPGAPVGKAIRAITIAEAKQGLAKTFGVSPEAVEITIRG